MEFSHLPVLLEECLEGLAIRPDGIYLDGTAGGAGHSREIAKRLTTGHLYSLDQDPDAIVTATGRLEGLPATVIQSNFRNARAALAGVGVSQIDGALLDLGVSSHQLDTAERGFSYLADAPLDMRMSQSGPTAADLVNTASREELARILREYGEEPFAWAIHRPPAGGQALCHHRAAGGRRGFGGSRSRAPQGQKPRPPHLPGHPHRRQRRAGRFERGPGRDL